VAILAVVVAFPVAAADFLAVVAVSLAEAHRENGEYPK